MADRNLNVRLIIRNDTAANWTTANPVLLKGEMGVEIDTHKFKFGDGTTAWNALTYGAGATEIKTAAPTPADSDYDIGTVWVDTTTKKPYIIVDNTDGAAVWQQVVTPDELSNLGAGETK